MPEKTEQQNIANEENTAEKRAPRAHVTMPNAFLHPYVFTAKDGSTWDKAYVHIPDGVKVNGIPLGGYSFDVFMNDYMKQQMLSGKQVSLSLKPDEPIAVWTGSKDDAEHPYKRFEVNPWDLVKGIKAEREGFDAAAYAAAKSAERDGKKDLASEVEASRDASSALEGNDGPDKPAPTR